MKQQIQDQEEWLRVLSKGMVTIPKTWREEFGFNEGDIIKARKSQGKIIIETVNKPVPYRVYSQKEFQQFIKDDKLPEKVSREIDRKLNKND
jgi:AbrB family looped-hinge helix DNA binding protein